MPKMRTARPTDCRFEARLRVACSPVEPAGRDLVWPSVRRPSGYRSAIAKTHSGTGSGCQLRDPGRAWRSRSALWWECLCWCWKWKTPDTPAPTARDSNRRTGPPSDYRTEDRCRFGCNPAKPLVPDSVLGTRWAHTDHLPVWASVLAPGTLPRLRRRRIGRTGNRFAIARTHSAPVPRSPDWSAWPSAAKSVCNVPDPFEVVFEAALVVEVP